MYVFYVLAIYTERGSSHKIMMDIDEEMTLY